MPSPNVSSLATAPHRCQLARGSSSTASAVVARTTSRWRQRTVGGWLLACGGMCLGAIGLGGVTRLTESGLSMVDWHLIKGMRPPLTEDEWRKEFAKYQMYPEYAFKTGDREMTLGEFKFIWRMEWAHRMWGRAIGVVFFVPAAVFWARGWLTSGVKARVVVAGALLVGQGLLGWYMVKSGLDPSGNTDKQVPRVSQHRLAAHLSGAMALYALLLWTGLGRLLTPVAREVAGIGRLRTLTLASSVVVFTTACIGALVAGLDAGLVYNSWPKFADKWLPDDMWAKEPAWRNFSDNPSMVQFVHREMAYLTLAVVATTWLAGRRLPLHRRARLALHGMAAAVCVQAGLGITTLLLYVPVWAAALHQQGSMLLLSMALWLGHEIRRVPK